MLAKLKTYSLLGIDALPVEVEVDVSPGAVPKTTLVGLPEAAVRESLHRVERAMVNSGFIRPSDHIVINMAPAELPKQAASFDLPISLGMLAASGQLASELFETYAVVGELALEGTMRPIKGALSIAMAAAKQVGVRGILVPAENASEAGGGGRLGSHPRQQFVAGGRLFQWRDRDPTATFEDQRTLRYARQV